MLGFVTKIPLLEGQMKKVLLLLELSTVDWGSKNAGGLDTVCQQIASSIEASECKDFKYVIVAFSISKNTLTKPICRNINPNVTIVFYSNLKKLRVIPNFLARAIVARRHFNIEKPDIVHSHLMPLLLLIPRSAKSILTLHSYKKFGRKSVGLVNDFIHETIIPRFVLPRVSVINTIGSDLKKLVNQDGYVAVKSVNPIDPIFTSNYCKRDFSLINTKFLICGNIHPYKGTLEGIQLFKRIVSSGFSAHLTVVGQKVDLEYLTKIQKYIADHSLEDLVSIIDPVPKVKLVELYKSNQYGIFLSKQESFGLVPIEMASTGMKVLVHKVGVLSDSDFNFPADQFFIVNENANIDELTAFLTENLEYGLGYVLERFNITHVLQEQDKQYINLLSVVA